MTAGRRERSALRLELKTPEREQTNSPSPEHQRAMASKQTGKLRYPAVGQSVVSVELTVLGEQP
jgi:hypothetical protein